MTNVNSFIIWCRKSLGMSLLRPLNIRPSISLTSIVSKNSSAWDWHFSRHSGQPYCMTFISAFICGSAWVADRTSSILLPLIRILEITVCTCKSMPSATCGRVSGKQLRERVSAICITLPGMCVNFRLYACNCKKYCSLAGVCASGLEWKATKGLWFVWI